MSASEEPQILVVETAHPLISVKDFAYNTSEELHYGVLDYPQEGEVNDNARFRKSIINIPSYKYFQDGPPWQEDPEIKTPRFVQDEEGTEYEFSITSSDEIHGKAVALFDFEPENDNEVRLTEGQIIWISYRHGQGWLVAEDHLTGETGLVPEEYVQLISDDKDMEDEEDDEPRQVLPELMQVHNEITISNDSDWVDEEEEDNHNNTMEGLPSIEHLKLK